jgi:arginase
MSPPLHLIGSAYGFGAGNIGCGDGPTALQQHLQNHPELNLQAYWHTIIQQTGSLAPLDDITQLNQQIAKASYNLSINNQLPVNIGGDHSCAIGMWSGIAKAKRPEGDIGLIWVDAHLDAHTFETTPTGNIHGMPVAALLGYGDKSLTHIADEKPKIKPENLVFLGARSYESGEHDLLKKLGVTIYYMEDIKQHGFSTLYRKAVKQASQHTIGYGLSFDLDGIDPLDAPGVGTPETGGLRAREVLTTWKKYDFSTLIGLEVVEYNPHLDKNNKTLEILINTLKLIQPA